MKNRVGPLDLKSRPSPYCWVRRNSRESTNFHFGPVEGGFPGQRTTTKAPSLHKTSIDSARRDSRSARKDSSLFFQTFQPSFVISWRISTNKPSLESLRSQQSDGAIFVPALPKEQTIAPFLRRVLTLSAQFPRICTCSGQINLYRGETAVIHKSNMHLSVKGCVAFARRRFAVVACRRIVRRIKKKPVYSLPSLRRTNRNGGFSAPSI